MERRQQFDWRNQNVRRGACSASCSHARRGGGRLDHALGVPFHPAFSLLSSRLQSCRHELPVRGLPAVDQHAALRRMPTRPVHGGALRRRAARRSRTEATRAQADRRRHRVEAGSGSGDDDRRRRGHRCSPAARCCRLHRRLSVDGVRHLRRASERVGVPGVWARVLPRVRRRHASAGGDGGTSPTDHRTQEGRGRQYQRDAISSAWRGDGRRSAVRYV